MSGRDARVAKNESVSREINEDIDEATTSKPDAYVRMVCECGRADCNQVIAITPEEYERVRADPRRFAIARDHVMPDVETVVAENDRFAVVQKREGTPAQVSEAFDPRS